MENYIIEATVFEPRVELNFRDNKLLFSGESRPENVHTFYGPIFTKIDEYENYLKSNPATTVECVFKFEYFNSASSKSILDIIERLAKIKENMPSVNLKIEWYYDAMDDDMKEAGLEFEEITEMKFDFCEVS